MAMNSQVFVAVFIEYLVGHALVAQRLIQVSTHLKYTTSCFANLIKFKQVSGGVHHKVKLKIALIKTAIKVH